MSFWYLSFVNENGQIFNFGLACVSASLMVMVNILGMIHLSGVGAGLVGLILCTSSFHLGGMIRSRDAYRKVARKQSGG